MTTETAINPRAKVLEAMPKNDWPGSAEALLRVQELPIPGRKSEAWKYTQVAKLFKQNFQEATGEVEVSLPERLTFETIRIVFVNGHYRADLSDDLKSEPGIVVDSLKTHLSHGPVQKHYGNIVGENDRLFTAMNTASPTDGLIILATKGRKMSKPLHVLHVVTQADALIQPRDLIMVQEDAEVEVIFETISGPAGVANLPPVQGSLINSVRETVVGTNAKCTFHILQNDLQAPTQITQDAVHIADKGNFSIDTTTLNGSLIRNDVSVALLGPNAHAELNGVYLLDGTTHCDNHTYIGHDVPDCTSDELYKGIISDKATTVFNGKVYVKQDAQRTRAYQSNANILQGDHASAYTKPELEIYADDVKCSHGCTIGRLDEQALFYMRSRGVSEKEARRLLAQAFAIDVLERITNEVWRAHLNELILDKLAP